MGERREGGGQGGDGQVGPAVDAPAEGQAEPVPADVRVRVC